MFQQHTPRGGVELPTDSGGPRLWCAQVELFCELLRHKTISLEGPAGAYTECADFIQGWCERIGLSCTRVTPVENKVGPLPQPPCLSPRSGLAPHSVSESGESLLLAAEL